LFKLIDYKMAVSLAAKSGIRKLLEKNIAIYGRLACGQHLSGRFFGPELTNQTVIRNISLSHVKLKKPLEFDPPLSLKEAVEKTLKSESASESASSSSESDSDSSSSSSSDSGGDVKQKEIVVAAAEPEAVVAAEPEAVVAAEPEVVEAAEPEAIVAAEPEVVVAAEPEVVVAAEPEAVVAAEPEAVVAAEPEVVVTAEPEAVSAAEIEAVLADLGIGETEASNVNKLVIPGIIVPEDTVITIYEEMVGEYKGRATVNYSDIFILYKAEVEMEQQRLEQPHPKIPYYHKIP